MAREVVVDRMHGGMLRITIVEDGSMVNRRRDVAPERKDEVIAALIAELDD